jgi:mannose-1-phosphate guanylyltransferase
MLEAVIVVRGSGTQLWPLPRAAHPKQFLALYSKYNQDQAN